jgi:acetolactate synthase-1/2/3 large subunit
MIEFMCDPSEIILPMVPAGGGIKDMITSVDDEPTSDHSGRI